MGNCNGTGLAYNFTLFYLFQNLSSSATQWIQFSKNKYLTKTGRENEQFSIEKQLFKDYPYTTWKVQLTGSFISFSNQSLKSDSSLLFYVNYSPTNGTCNVDPKNGTTKDLFTLTCLNWLDSGGGFLARYFFYGKFDKNFDS